MKRHYGLLILMILLLAVGFVSIALAQTAVEEEQVNELSFQVEAEIGRALPRSLIYDPVFDQYAVIDAYGRLLLMDALTYETRFILYEQGNYYDFAFSNNGQWLALAIGSRIELYNTQTGELAADLVDLGQAIRIQGPLEFSRDDNLLKFEGLYPAPQSLRLSENDTSIVPWIWNLTAARNEGESTFPNRVEAWQFFDYRNGFVLGPDDRLVAALPGRLQVLDPYTLDVLFEIATDRYEQDPLTVFYSLRDDQIYVRPVNESALIQVDTERGVLVEFPLRVPLTLADLEIIGGIELSDQARVIGEPASRRQNDLLAAILGQNYREAFDFNPLTVTLLDFVVPPANIGDSLAALLFIYDEQVEAGYFTLSRPSGFQQMVLNQDNSRLMVRRSIDIGEVVQTFDLDSGELLTAFVPALRDLGSYDRFRKNRVLAYDASGDIVLSDFQRIAAATTEVLAEDLRYSRRFDRFFYTDDSQNIVTLSGTEWRLWDGETGEVLRREVLRLNGSIAATSSDGYRFLTYFTDSSGRQSAETVDLETGDRRSVAFANLPGTYVEQVIQSPDWEHFLIVYGNNPYGQYTPGNEVAMYSLNDGFMWHIAGDDLPPLGGRSYGWVDLETVYITGEGYRSEQPARIFGVEADASGLPACVVQVFPESVDLYTDLWERLVLRLRPDTLALLSQLICADLPDAPEAIQELLLPTATPAPITPTPIVIPGVPVCLTARYPARSQDYAEVWAEITAGLSAEDVALTETLLCEGIGEIPYSDSSQDEYISLNMLIDIETGERASGAFTPIERQSRPLNVITEEFERDFERPPGTFILSPDEQTIAVSSLPGELVIFRLLFSYREELSFLTQTAAAELATANLIRVLPSPTPTYSMIGTARPTLTPTVTPTPYPRPDERVFDAPVTEELCPAETLFTLDNLPDGYSPVGRLIGRVQGDALWRIEPEDGRRVPDETIPPCESGIDCRWSPDRQWILVYSTNAIYLIRPDGSDQRLLYDLSPDADPVYIPSEIRWSGGNTLEYIVPTQIEIDGQFYTVDAFQRDILGVFPDPDPWWPNISVNEIDADLIARQPGGPLAVVRTTFSTGIGPGYKYYIYHTETGEYSYFARVADQGEVSFSWHPLGDRLFYYYQPLSNERVVWYQFNADDGQHYYLGNQVSGIWSTEGRYRAFSTGRRTQQVGVWDSQTGAIRTYCVPETGARTYDGPFFWSPDSRYLALQAFLPEDEADPEVGQHTLILDIETGAVVDLTTGVAILVDWSREPGQYGE